MIENKEWPVKFRWRLFPGIEQLGFNADGKFIVSLFPCPPPAPRGGYFTVPPVSGLKWRREHGQSERLHYRDDGTAFVLHDEYGEPYRFETCREAIEQLVAESIANDVPPYSAVSESDGLD